MQTSNQQTIKPKLPLLAGLLGTVLEWYDFGIYIYLAPVIAPLFFPAANKYLNLMLAYSVFTVGYLARPLGGIIFGHFGDRIGRKSTFVVTILLMALATFFIGLLPTYAQIGVAAPALLTLLRLLQGLSASGETVGTLALFFESVSSKRKGVVTSLLWSGSGIGFLVASAIIALLTHVFSAAAIQAWAWRLPFLIGLAAGLTAYILRRRAQESNYFLALKQQSQLIAFPLREIFAAHKKTLSKLFIIFVPSAVSYYMIFVCMPGFVSQLTSVSLATASSINTFATLVLIIMTPLMGLLSDKIGHKRLLLTALIGFIILSAPLYWLISQGHSNTLLLAQLLFAICNACYAGALMAYSLEAVPAHIRYSMIGLGYNTSYSIFGGTTPLVASFLLLKTGNALSLAWYLIIAALVALPIIIFSKQHSHA